MSDQSVSGEFPTVPTGLAGTVALLPIHNGKSIRVALEIAPNGEMFLDMRECRELPTGLLLLESNGFGLAVRYLDDLFGALLHAEVRAGIIDTAELGEFCP